MIRSIRYGSRRPPTTCKRIVFSGKERAAGRATATGAPGSSLSLPTRAARAQAQHMLGLLLQPAGTATCLFHSLSKLRVCCQVSAVGVWRRAGAAATSARCAAYSARAPAARAPVAAGCTIGRRLPAAQLLALGAAVRRLAAALSCCQLGAVGADPSALLLQRTLCKLNPLVHLCAVFGAQLRGGPSSQDGSSAACTRRERRLTPPCPALGPFRPKPCPPPCAPGSGRRNPQSPAPSGLPGGCRAAAPGPRCAVAGTRLGTAHYT